MGTFSVGGLASGLDTKAIVSQLVQIDSRPKIQLEWAQQRQNARKAAWTDLSGKLATLQSSASTVVSASTWSPATGQTQQQWIDSVVTKVQDFVRAYNTTLDLVHERTQVESRVTKPANPSTGLTKSEYLQGPVARDADYAGVATQLKMQVGDAVAGLAAGSNLLADIGITSSYSSSGTSGLLTVDAAALTAALTADPSRVQAVLSQVGSGSGVTADDGIVRRVSELASQMRVGGVVDAAIQGAGTRATSLQASIERASATIERRQAYYERMFSKLESTLGALQNRGSWLQSQLSSLNQN